MAKTKAELRNRALQKIGKLALGQTPESALASDMEDAYDQVYARLARKGMVEWAPADDVPDEFVEDITALMAFERSENIPGEVYARVGQDAARAFKNISSTLSGRWVNDKKVEDF